MKIKNTILTSAAMLALSLSLPAQADDECDKDWQQYDDRCEMVHNKQITDAIYGAESPDEADKGQKKADKIYKKCITQGQKNYFKCKDKLGKVDKEKFANFKKDVKALYKKKRKCRKKLQKAHDKCEKAVWLSCLDEAKKEMLAGPENKARECYDENVDSICPPPNLEEKCDEDENELKLIKFYSNMVSSE
ncbi:hypothetical protein [Candidatus Venteria ishoeyi]|uniref:Uncharacterized protein n=1 Tax=Candidatus Venteria ishoeyi TaxID=1899563 RepID=A0A1H6FF58_9GAMM|nr:hypothetical protein [Candidatus Venteria ishoeyi]SEH08273.1 Uncharacterised protein [Candidatus Venteria ishoeyi]